MSDLIDRKALKQLMMANYLQRLWCGRTYGMGDALKSVDRAPAVNAELERKTGRRLIDADVLKSAIDEHVYLVSHGHNESEFGITQVGVWQIIDEQPTVDIVPALPEWAQKIDRMYNEALGKQGIHNPLAWAIYQVWKEYDK